MKGVGTSTMLHRDWKLETGCPDILNLKLICTELELPRDLQSSVTITDDI